MSAQHTPGPWQVFTPEPGRVRVGRSINAESADFVATLFDGSQKEANARLIAAAPELLAVVRRWLNCPDLSLENLEVETLDAIQQAEEVANKAEGRP